MQITRGIQHVDESMLLDDEWDICFTCLCSEL